MTRVRSLLAVSTWLALCALVASCEWMVDVRGRCTSDDDCLATELCAENRCLARTAASDGGTGLDRAAGADRNPGDASAADHGQRDSTAHDDAAARDAVPDAAGTDLQATDHNSADSLVADVRVADAAAADIAGADAARDGGSLDTAPGDQRRGDSTREDVAPFDHGHPGQPVALVNGDFEANTLKTWFWNWNGTRGNGALVPGAIPGWSTDENPGIGGPGGKGDSGVETGGNPGMRLFLNSIDWDVYQTTGYTIQAGDAFQLGWDARLTGAFGTYQMQALLATIYYLDGTSRVPIQSSTVYFDQTVFVPYRLDVDSVPAAAVGKPIGISFDNFSNQINGGNQSWLGIDNVTLTVFH
jgi:hypothetical protein